MDSSTPSSNTPTPAAATRALEWLRALRRTPRDAHEALALTVHALLLGHGFRDADVDAGSESTVREDWGVGGYGGRYRHARSALTFEVRATPLGTRLRVTGVHDAAQDDDVATLNLPVATHYVESAADGAHWTDGLQDLNAVATLVLIQVAHRLVPGAAKEGYEAGTQAAASSSNAQPQQAPPPMPAPQYLPPPDNDPLRIGPVRGGPRPLVPPYGPEGFPAADGFGQDDLMPALPRMPGFGSVGGIGMGGGFGRGGGGMGGGNLMGPRNFMPPFRGQAPMGRGRGGLPPGVPPGARYDPMGPGGVGPDNNIERPPPDDDDPPSGMYW